MSPYNLRPFKEAPPSSIKGLPIIQLEAIDLSLFEEGPENYPTRKALADHLEKSVSTTGFFSIINHGISEVELASIRSIAQSTLEIPDDEKKKYSFNAPTSDQEDRTQNLGAERAYGFKPKGYWTGVNGVKDSIEFYNFRELQQKEVFNDQDLKYPDPAKDNLPEIVDYFRKLHLEVLKKLSILCDIVLELPEGYLWENYFKVIDSDHHNSGSGFGRFMTYHKLSEEEDKAVEGNWLRGHSDGNAFTFLTSQPILSLQIRDYNTGEWKYVGHTPGGIIVNIGDALEFITGGYFKSSIHRVITPPKDQINYRRLVIIYFSLPKYSAWLNPEPLNSGKLKRLGFGESPKEWDKISFEQWDDEKGRLFGKGDINNKPGDEPEPVLIYGRYHERWHHRT